MSRAFDAKQAALKAYPIDREAGAQLLLEFLDASESDFAYEEGMSPEEYIYGKPVPAPVPRIFVFGSNLAGRHGKGAALHARNNCGAKYGKGTGRTGMAYAIPTKGFKLEVLPLDRIGRAVSDFIAYAQAHPELRFQVTPIGTGEAGYSHAEIKPMFAGAPANCDLPEEWTRL